eukprot:gene3801-8377_t
MAAVFHVCFRPSSNNAWNSVQTNVKEALKTLEKKYLQDGILEALLIHDWESELNQDDIPMFITMDLAQRHDLIIAFVDNSELESPDDTRELLAELRDINVDVSISNELISYTNIYLTYALKMGTPLIVIHPNEMGAPCAKFCQHLSSVHAGIVKSSRSSSSQLLLASLTDLQTMIRLSLFIENCINSSISLLQRKSYIKPSQHPFDFHRACLFSLASQKSSWESCNTYNLVKSAIGNGCRVINVHGNFGTGKSYLASTFATQFLAKNPSASLVIHKCTAATGSKQLHQVITSLCTQLGLPSLVTDLYSSAGSIQHKARISRATFWLSRSFNPWRTAGSLYAFLHDICSNTMHHRATINKAGDVLVATHLRAF